MMKWQSNLIILTLVFIGLGLSAPDMDRLFFSEVVKAPEKVNIEPQTSATVKKENQNEVQIGSKNATINSGAEKTSIEGGTTKKEENSSSLNWEDFNQMNQAQLETINGVGPVLAKRILDYKEEHGPFKSFEELNKVKGIGPKLLEKIKKQFGE